MIEIRKSIILRETVFSELGVEANRPIPRAVGMAVIRNPFASQFVDRSRRCGGAFGLAHTSMPVSPMGLSADSMGGGNPAQIWGCPAYDPIGPDGANVNLVIGDEVLDPVSGAAPHRAYPCQLHKLDD
jgi:hypothetical protein